MKVMLITAPFGFNTLLPMLTSQMGVFMDLQANVFDSKGHRDIVEHRVPGRDGGPLQDMGSNATIYTISGKWINENLPSNLRLTHTRGGRALSDIRIPTPTSGVGVISAAERMFGGITLIQHLISKIGWNWLRVVDIERLYYSRAPIMLMCDLAPGSLCLIEDKHFIYRGGLPNVYEYTLVLREFSTPLMKAVATPAALMASAATSWGELGH